MRLQHHQQPQQQPVGRWADHRPWFGDETDKGTGLAMVNNTSGISKIIVDSGIVVSGMLNATVTGNSLDTTILNVSSCPTGNINAAISAGWASGTIQGPYTNVEVSQCVSH